MCNDLHLHAEPRVPYFLVQTRGVTLIGLQWIVENPRAYTTVPFMNKENRAHVAELLQKSLIGAPRRKRKGWVRDESVIEIALRFR